MKLKKHLFRRLYCLAGIVLLMAACPMGVQAQVSNDNEDGVYKVKHPGTHDYVPGQVLFCH